jgi:hypothetical protein
VPVVPHDACGLPQPSVLRAMQGLSWKTVKVTRVAQVRTQLEVDTGCPGDYKPVVAISAAAPAGSTGSTGPIFGATPPKAVTLCRYMLNPTSSIGLAGGTTLLLGSLSAASTLTGAKLDRLVAAVDAAPPVKPGCGLPQAAFGVLLTGGAPGDHLAIELGGCFRLLTDDGRLRQLTAATVAALG